MHNVGILQALIVGEGKVVFCTYLTDILCNEVKKCLSMRRQGGNRSIMADVELENTLSL